MGLSEEHRTLLEQRGASEKVEENDRSLTSIPPLDLIPESRMEIYETGEYQTIRHTVDNHKSDLTKWDEKGGTVLGRICEHNTLTEKEAASLAAYVIKRGANSSTFHKVSGRRAMHAAAINNKMLLMRVLLNRGSTVNEKTLHGETPLMLAVSFPENGRAIRFLIERGADVNATSHKDVSTSPGGGMTALHCAASQSQSNLHILKQAGANTKCRTNKGWGTSEFLDSNPQYREAPLFKLVVDNSIPKEEKISRVKDLLSHETSNEKVLLKSFQQVVGEYKIMSLFKDAISQEKRLAIVKESLENLSERLKEKTKELKKYEQAKEKGLDVLKVISLLIGDEDFTEWRKVKRDFYFSGRDEKLDEKIQSAKTYIADIEGDITSLSDYLNAEKASKIVVCVPLSIYRPLLSRPLSG